MERTDAASLTIGLTTSAHTDIQYISSSTQNCPTTNGKLGRIPIPGD